MKNKNCYIIKVRNKNLYIHYVEKEELYRVLDGKNGAAVFDRKTAQQAVKNSGAKNLTIKKIHDERIIHTPTA